MQSAVTLEAWVLFPATETRNIDNFIVGKHTAYSGGLFLGESIITR